MPTATADVRRYRAQYAALTRDRAADDPDLLAARHNLFLAQRRGAAEAALSAAQTVLDGRPFADTKAAVNVRDVPVEMVLYEAVELLATMLRATDDPSAAVAVLRANAGGSDLTR